MGQSLRYSPLLCELKIEKKMVYMPNLRRPNLFKEATEIPNYPLGNFAIVGDVGPSMCHSGRALFSKGGLVGIPCEERITHMIRIIFKYRENTFKTTMKTPAQRKLMC